MVFGVVRVVAIQIQLQGWGWGLSKKLKVVGVVRVVPHYPNYRPFLGRFAVRL